MKINWFEIDFKTLISLCKTNEATENLRRALVKACGIPQEIYSVDIEKISARTYKMWFNHNDIGGFELDGWKITPYYFDIKPLRDLVNIVTYNSLLGYGTTAIPRIMYNSGVHKLAE